MSHDAAGRKSEHPQSDGVKANQSLKKAFLIIEALVQNGGRLRLQNLAAAVGMPSPTVLRFLNALSELGYVARERDSAVYRLTSGLAELGYRVKANLSFTTVLHPFLEEVRRTLGESTSLSIAEGDALIYVDTAEGPDHMLRTHEHIGKAAPLHGTGAGKVILCTRSAELIRRYAESSGLPALTENTITDTDALLQELERVAGQGYALDDDECEIGVRCVAAPVRDFTGTTVAAISVSAPASRLSAHRVPAALEVLQNVARRASAELGWRGPADGRTPGE